MWIVCYFWKPIDRGKELGVKTMMFLFLKEGCKSGVEGGQWGVRCGYNSWSFITVAADRRSGSGR
jgi:hypothetical protein